MFLYMITSSKRNIFRVTGPLCGEFVGHRWIPLTKASDAELWCFFFICAWANGWINNRDAGDLIRHRAHYGVTVMFMYMTPLLYVYQKGRIPLHRDMIKLSLRPGDVYMRQWIKHHWFRLWSVALSVPNHYLNQGWNIANSPHRNKLQLNFNRNSCIFFQENAFKMSCSKWLLFYLGHNVLTWFILPVSKHVSGCLSCIAVTFGTSYKAASGLYHFLG